METETPITPIIFDLDGMMMKTMNASLEAHVDPPNKRAGGHFLPTVAASWAALTSAPLKEQATLAGVTHKNLLAIRSQSAFKSLVEKNTADVAGEVMRQMIALSITRTLDRWKHAKDSMTPYQPVPVQILFSYLSWDCYRRIIGAVTTAILDVNGFRSVVNEALGREAEGLFLYSAGLELQASFFRPLLEGAKQEYKRTKKELALFSSAAFDAQLTLCCQQIMAEAQDTETPERERLTLIKDYITALMRVHGKLPAVASKGA
jgi:hypothetical protein